MDSFDISGYDYMISLNQLSYTKYLRRLKQIADKSALNDVNQFYYGSKSDFISDMMEECLKHNIISKYASDNSFWLRNNIQIIENDYIYMTDPYTGLRRYKEETTRLKEKKWDFDIEFKKVLLPKNYTLVKCPVYGKNLAPDTFSLVKNNRIIKTFVYFGKK